VKSHLVDCHDQLLDSQGFRRGGSSDHVLVEVAVAGGIDDGNVDLRNLELPKGDVDGDFTLSIQFVQHPRILEGT